MKITKATAKKINALHEDILAQAQRTFESAKEMGGLLCEVKESLNHGEWIPWLEKNIKFSLRTATRYMRLHTWREELNKSDSVSDLTEAYERVNRLSSKKMEGETSKAEVEMNKRLERRYKRSAKRAMDTRSKTKEREKERAVEEFRQEQQRREEQMALAERLSLAMGELKAAIDLVTDGKYDTADDASLDTIKVMEKALSKIKAAVAPKNANVIDIDAA